MLYFLFYVLYNVSQEKKNQLLSGVWEELLGLRHHRRGGADTDSPGGHIHTCGSSDMVKMPTSAVFSAD